MQLQKTLIVLLDELVFRPAVWLINWKPSANRPVHYYWKDDDDE